MMRHVVKHLSEGQNEAVAVGPASQARLNTWSAKAAADSTPGHLLALVHAMCTIITALTPRPQHTCTQVRVIE